MQLLQPAVVLLVLQFVTLATTQDPATTPGAQGVDVVKDVVKKIQDSGIFPDDHDFLIRVAQVESDCGEDPNTYRDEYHGGIWQVDEIGFEDTQDTTSHPGLQDKFDKIEEEFGIKWEDVTWEDLRKPLYSAIAARLFISNIPEAIPDDVEGQAEYWKQHYNTEAGAGTEQDFIDRTSSAKGDPHISQTLPGSNTSFNYDVDGSDGDIFTFFSDQSNDIKINVQLIKVKGNHKAKYIGSLAVFTDTDTESVYIDHKGVKVDTQHYHWKTGNDVPFGPVGHVHFHKKGVLVDIDGLVWLDVTRKGNSRRHHLDFVLNHLGNIGPQTSGIIGDVGRIASIVEKDKKLILTNTDSTTTSVLLKHRKQSWVVDGPMPEELKDIILNNKVACLAC